MSLPDIRFQDIRPHDSSRNTGFEQLCCQLASLEPRPAGAIFFRKGRGADAGLECFTRLANGDEKGWQAKYVEGWSSSFKAQLDKSIRTALDKHPQLKEYIVCLPFDLPDARVGKGLTPLAHWQNWRDAWIASAKEEGRVLSIELWGANEIGQRLTANDPAYAGRLLYWFEQEALTHSWFRQQFEKSRAALGSRYMPESNVELPIRRDFLAFVRDPSILAEVEQWRRSLQERGHNAVAAIKRARGTDPEPHSDAIEATVGQLIGKLGAAPIGPDQPFPLASWEAAAIAAELAVRLALCWSNDLPIVKSTHGTSPAEWARHELYRLSDLVNDVSIALGSQRWKIVNLGQLLLVGEAGSGKSHLLADVVDHQIEAGAPALLVLGSMLNDSEPWRQILAQLDMPPARQVKHFLAALDAAGEAAGVRALVCVDAINERHGIEIWPDRLAAFLKEIEPFHRVVVCVSCRTTYLPYVVPDRLDDAVLPGCSIEGSQEHQVRRRSSTWICVELYGQAHPNFCPSSTLPSS